MDTYAALLGRLANEGFEEARNLEFKRGGRWNDIKYPVARAVLAMSNLEGGGQIVVGIDEDKSGEDRLAGMDGEDSATFRADEVSEFVNRYADPHVQIQLQKISEAGRHFVVLGVPEFSYQPILCKKSLDAADKKYLEDGRLYYRPRGKVESTAKLTHNDVRELLGMAVVKHYKYLQRQCERMGGGAAGRPEGEAHGS